MKFRVFIEKNDHWVELGIFEGNTKEEALDNARNSQEILNFYTTEEIPFVNLEVE